MLTAIINAAVYTGAEIVRGKSLLIRDGRIESFTEPGSVPETARRIDCKGNSIAPGLIDLQIAGGGGYLFSDDPTPEALEAIAGAIVRDGTTGFLIVIPTNSFEVIRKTIRIIRDNPHTAILGLHLEGPYINPARSGAHDKALIRKPDKDEITGLLKEAGGIIKMVTVAPELCDAGFIQVIKDHGAVVAAGHSNATFPEASSGFDRGVGAVTHLFNAMSPLHHRDPGLPGAAFLDSRACASIIADGIHVDYSTLRIAKRIMKERLYLVSDAVEENAGGSYRHVRQDDRFTLPDGTLSGSLLSMLAAVRNCVENAGISVDEALRMASTYPARLINAGDRGQIAPGFRADIIEFDSDFQLKRVYTKGYLALENEADKINRL